MNHIYLIGFMGTGKSTVGRALAQSMNREFTDSDELIVSRDGRSIPTIFTEEGEEYFRKLERRVMADIAAGDEPCVVSCGGGVVLSEENRLTMKNSGTVVWLTASPEEILRRVKADDNRPLLAGKKTLADIENMIDHRRSFYEAAGDLVIDTDNRSVDEIIERIMLLWNTRSH